MLWRRWMFNSLYRRGNPRWDTGITPPEVVAVIEGPDALPAGRALDLGCGTGTNAIYLARHGWDVTGVDFSPLALQQARQKAMDIPKVRFVEGDVSQLSHLNVNGPFDFVLDIGCFHGLTDQQRGRYVQEVARVTRPGAIMMLFAFTIPRRLWFPIAPRMGEHEIADRFGNDFVVERVEGGTGRWSARWYTLRRR
jgi:SAM-dependent methyltransferase